MIVPSGRVQSHRQLFDRDHCDPVHVKVVDCVALPLGVGPSSTEAIQLPDEQSVDILYDAV